MYFAARSKNILRATVWILFVWSAATAQDKPRLLDMAPPKTEAADKPNSIDGLIRAANQGCLGTSGLATGSALQAVRQRKYEPTLLDGKPVEVETTVDVILQLNNLR
jgi:hypothetical protein